MAFNSQTLGIAANMLTRTLISPRDYFLSTMETWLATPKTDNSQWVVLIEHFPEEISGGLLSSIVGSAKNALASFGIGESSLTWVQEHEDTTGDKDGWNQQLAGSLLGGAIYNDLMGCIFATSVNIPELDTISATDISVDNNGGFKKGVITNGRAGYATTPLSIDFRETYSSFGDLIIKPWTFMTAQYGMLPGFNHKTTLIIMEYVKSNQKLPMIPSKIYQFEGCCPISVQGDDLKYAPQNGEIVKNTKWLFSRYSIRQNMYAPVSDLLKKDGFNNVLNSNIF